LGSEGVVDTLFFLIKTNEDGYDEILFWMNKKEITQRTQASKGIFFVLIKNLEPY